MVPSLGFASFRFFTWVSFIHTFAMHEIHWDSLQHFSGLFTFVDLLCVSSFFLRGLTSLSLPLSLSRARIGDDDGVIDLRVTHHFSRVSLIFHSDGQNGNTSTLSFLLVFCYGLSGESENVCQGGERHDLRFMGLWRLE